MSPASQVGTSGCRDSETSQGAGAKEAAPHEQAGETMRSRTRVLWALTCLLERLAHSKAEQNHPSRTIQTVLRKVTTERRRAGTKRARNLSASPGHQGDLGARGHETTLGGASSPVLRAHWHHGTWRPLRVCVGGALGT